LRKGLKESIIDWLKVMTVTVVSLIVILHISLPILLGCEFLSTTAESVNQFGLKTPEGVAEGVSREGNVKGESEQSKSLEQSIGVNQPLLGSTSKKIHYTLCVKGEVNSKTAPLPTGDWVMANSLCSPDNTSLSKHNCVTHTYSDNTDPDNPDNTLAPDSPSDSQPSEPSHLSNFILILISGVIAFVFVLMKGESMAAKKTEMITKWFSRKIAAFIAAVILLLPVSIKEPVWFAVCLTALSICFLICNVLEKKWSKKEEDKNSFILKDITKT
jgi:hypothetical protein